MGLSWSLDFTDIFDGEFEAESTETVEDDCDIFAATVVYDAAFHAVEPATENLNIVAFPRTGLAILYRGIRNGK